MKLGNIPVLSVRQPWASLITHGHKDIENRTWRPRGLGVIAIHASQGWDARGASTVRAMGISQAFIDWCREYETGRVIGAVEVLRVETFHHSPWYSPGSLAWVLGKKPKRFSSEKVKGRLMLWRYPDLELTAPLRAK